MTHTEYRHPVQKSVANDQRVEQHRAEVGKECRELQIREDRVRLAQDRLERRIAGRIGGKCTGPNITMG